MRRRTLGPAVNAMIGQWVFWLAINLYFSFSDPGIALWAHLGGLATGFIIGALMTSTAGRQRTRASY
jgi:membrane associated rhomboid family serine protease